MHRRDRGLQRVRAEAPRRQRALDEREPLARSAPGSTASDPDRRAARSSPSADVRAARRDSCSSINASSPHASGSGSSSTSSRPSRIASSERSRRVERVARRRRVAFVEHEVDDVQHGVEPVGQVRAGGHLIRNLCVLDLVLGAHDALCHGRRAGEERTRDLLGGQSADLPEGERQLRVRRQGRMAAGEDEPQPVVVDDGIVERRPRPAPRRDAPQAAPARHRSERRRRIPSIALKRPVDTSHARGFSGIPSRGHRSTRGRKRVVQALPRPARSRRAGG